jgi:hypothetical protein
MPPIIADVKVEKGETPPKKTSEIAIHSIIPAAANDKHEGSSLKAQNLLHRLPYFTFLLIFAWPHTRQLSDCRGYV